MSRPTYEELLRRANFLEEELKKRGIPLPEVKPRISAVHGGTGWTYGLMLPNERQPYIEAMEALLTEGETEGR